MDWDNTVSYWSAALNLGAHPEAAELRTAETATTSALQSMQPIVAMEDPNGGFWGQVSGALGGTFGKLLDFQIAKEAHKAGMTGNATQAQPAQPVQVPQAGVFGGQMGGVLLIGGAVALVGLVLVLTRK